MEKRLTDLAKEEKKFRENDEYDNLDVIENKNWRAETRGIFEDLLSGMSDGELDIIIANEGDENKLVVFAFADELDIIIANEGDVDPKSVN